MWQFSPRIRTAVSGGRQPPMMLGPVRLRLGVVSKYSCAIFGISINRMATIRLRSTADSVRAVEPWPPPSAACRHHGSVVNLPGTASRRGPERSAEHIARMRDALARDRAGFAFAPVAPGLRPR
jgi:hypothetical protein